MKKALIVGLVLAFTAGLCLADTADRAPAAGAQMKDNVPAGPDYSTPYRPYVKKSGGKVWYLQEGFESSWLPAGWDTTRLSGTYATFVNRVTAGTVPTCSPHSGTYMVEYRCWYASTGNRMRLVAPPVQITGPNDSVTFWMTHDPDYASNNDRLIIEKMVKSGGTWGAWTAVDSFSRYQAAFNWGYHALPLGMHNGDSVRISFTGHSQYGNNFYMDDVSIGSEEIIAHNLAMQSIDVPASSHMTPNVPFTPTVTVSNPGGNPEVDFWVYYSIDDGSKTEVYSASQQVSDTLQPSDTAQFTFSDFTPVVGSYTVTAWVELAGDEYAGDDTLDFAFNTLLEWYYVANVPNGGGAYTRWSYHGSCASNGLLWMVGGRRDASWTVLNHVGTYDPATDTWDDTKPVLNQGRVYTTAAGNDQYIFLLGGRDPGGSIAYANVERLESPSGSAWANMTPLPAGRVFGTSVLAGGYVYYIGGTSDGGGSTPTTTFWRYDIAGDTTGGTPWDQTLEQLPATQMSPAATVYDGKIYVLGDATTNNTYVYDIAGGSWSTISNGSLPAAEQYSAVTVYDQIWRIGGIMAGASTPNVYVFDPATGTWSDGIPMLQTRTTFGCAKVGDVVVSAGGVAYPGFTPTMTAEAIDIGHLAPPEIVWTSPAHDETGVRRAQPVILAFSEPMDPGTLDGYFVPDIGGINDSWNATNDTLTLAHDSLFDYGTEYLVIITAGASPGGVPLAKLPDTLRFITWMAPDVIQDQMSSYGGVCASQIFEPSMTMYDCYIADDINLTGMDSVKVAAVELVIGGWNGHTWHPMDSLYLSFTTDSLDFPAWSQEIWGGNLAGGTFDDVYDGVEHNTMIMYLDPPVMLGNGKTWMMSSPYMNFASKGTKDGQCGWAQNNPATVYGSAPAWRNPGNGFGGGPDWMRASSITGMSGDGVFRLLGYAYPTGVAGGPTGAAKAVFALAPNFPNPVSGRTTFSFSLPRASDYSLKVYNIAGQMVQSFNGKGQAGANSVNWNAQKAGAGVYFFQLNAGGQSATRKLVVVK